MGTSRDNLLNRITELEEDLKLKLEKIEEIKIILDDGDYIEDTYEFETKSEAKKFAKQNNADEILEYKEGQDYDPKHIRV